MLLTKSQIEGDRLFADWFIGKGFKKKPILRQGGVAGTGKTTLLRYLMDKYGLNPSNCMVMAYTGQAVSVLRQKGIYANTIHSSIMHVRETLQRDSSGEVVKQRGVPVTKIEYVPVDFLPSTIKLIIIDESSFLPEYLEKIILRYNIPIYEVGDPLQLPPVAGAQCFYLSNLDHVLLEPMRQALDSEIYSLATKIRTYDVIDPSKYRKDVLFINPKKSIEKTFERFYPFFKHSNAILTSTNKQRDAINQLYRKNVIKTDNPFPIKGERLICRRNNKTMILGDVHLTNGTLGTCIGSVPRSQIDTRAGIFYMDFKPDFTSEEPDDYFDNMICDSEYLQAPCGDKNSLGFYNPGNKMEYAYAITTHLSQGAQFGTVLFMDSFNGNREYAMRLRYTAVTRARQKLLYMLP